MQKGFTLLELLISLSITLVLGAAVFQLFQQNERVFNDQTLITEMNQAARAAIFQAAGEIRVAGQGVPTYAESFGDAPSEETVAILSGSTVTRINFRAGLAPTSTDVTAPRPAQFTLGIPTVVTVADATGLYNSVGGSPAGRFAYFWGAADAYRWNWVRASLRSVSPASGSVGVTAVSIGPAGVGASPNQFSESPTMTLEEAFSLFYDSSTRSMRRTTASNMSDPIHPVWAPANELVPNVTQLQFEYLDGSGNSIEPDTLANRARISRVGVRLVVQTAQEVRNHTRPEITLSIRTNIRSAMIR